MTQPRMRDRLILHDLAVECRLGVYDWEREKPQTVWIDLELKIDASNAAASDDMREAVDYAKLVGVVKECLQRRSFRLLETAAEHIARDVLRGFSTPRVRVQIKKRALPEVDYAAVEIERSAAHARRAGRAGRRTARTGRAAGRR